MKNKLPQKQTESSFHCTFPGHAIKWQGRLDNFLAENLDGAMTVGQMTNRQMPISQKVLRHVVCFKVFAVWALLPTKTTQVHFL